VGRVGRVGRAPKWPEWAERPKWSQRLSVPSGSSTQASDPRAPRRERAAPEPPILRQHDAQRQTRRRPPAEIDRRNDPRTPIATGTQPYCLRRPTPERHWSNPNCRKRRSEERSTPTGGQQRRFGRDAEALPGGRSLHLAAQSQPTINPCERPGGREDPPLQRPAAAMRVRPVAVEGVVCFAFNPTHGAGQNHRRPTNAPRSLSASRGLGRP